MSNSHSVSSSDHTPDTSQISQPVPQTHHHFDIRWVIAIIIMLAATAIGIATNLNSHDNTATKIDGLVNIDNGDLKINWDRYKEIDIALSESLTITDSGVYHITGSLSDGMISINSGVKGEVKLILDNVSITNSTGPAISCISGDDLVIELIGDNTLKDGTDHTNSLDEDINSVIYSKADLTLEGDGSLTVKASYQDGIVGKDDLKFNSGSYTISAIDDGIRGKDSVYIAGGTFNILAQQDAIKSTNDTDPDKGFVLIENGNITLSAGDDGIHGERSLVIQSGAINIVKSYEGLEAPKIVINGGNISIASSDDGINANSNTSDTSTTAHGPATSIDENYEIIINDGNIYVNSSGDGIDSNGWIYFNGGSVAVDGPTNNGNGALDSGIGIAINGGTVVAIGSSGMAETLGNTSEVFNANIYFGTPIPAGTNLKLKDSDGNTIVDHTSAKSFSHAVIGTPKFALGNTYTIYLNDEKYQTFTISDVTTTIGNSNINTNTMPGGRKQ